MKYLAAALYAVSISAGAAVVGTLDGDGGYRLILTDEHNKCKGSFDAYIMTAAKKIELAGCWFGEDDHVTLDWPGDGRRYWPAVMIKWHRNSAIQGPGT
jgi:hypothetical protein